MSEKRYRSPLRDAQAEATRRRVCDAAQELFEEVGFSAATVAQIARRAGVSTATVYAAFDSKAGIISALLSRLEEEAGMEWRIPEMLAEANPHRSLRLFVAANRAVFEAGHGILRSAFDAIGIPEVKRLIESGDANRRRGVSTLVGNWHRQGALRSGLGPKRATDTMWLLTSAEQYLLATDVLLWSGATYERWLSEILDESLLVPAA